jgi:hypothetical protein
MMDSDPQETYLLRPVLRLFPKKRYYRFKEVPLGRKRIDMWCVCKAEENLEVCVELKVKDWRKALWQAIINFQMAKQSYIAIWHKYVQRVQKQDDLLKQYGVGLISVGPRSAKIIIQSENKGEGSCREDRKELYTNLVSV